MALRVRYSYPTSSQLGYSIERLSDGLFFDFADATFKASPTTTVAALPEDSSDFLGRYKVTLSPTPMAQFTDGSYTVTIHDRQTSNAVVAELAVVFRNGDDLPTFATGSTASGTDPWATVLSGSYPAGTAGAILGQNLDARVSTRSTFDGGVVASVTAPVTVAVDPWSVLIPGSYPAGSAGAVLGGNIDAPISTRSTFDGGVVASVTAPVTVAVDPWSVLIPGSYPAGSAGAVLGGNIDAPISTRSTFDGGVVASVTAPVTVAVDPWSVLIPGSYPAGSAGAVLGGNIDAPISTRSTFDGGVVASVTAPVTVAVDPWSVLIPGSYPAGSAGAVLGGNIDAPISTRSTFDGGVVASVTAPVTVGTMTDKTGYTLAAAGLDAIEVEAGVNARQALSPILAASAGVVAGAGTGVVIIKGGNSSVTRITATTDNAGNRSSVTLSLPS